MKTFKRLFLGLAALGLLKNASAASPLRRDTLPYNWHLLDAQGPYFGISLDKAYELLRGRQPKTVIAGIIDSGIDTLHSDLQAVLWHADKKEKSYPGMHYGWSYLGSGKGNIRQENLELVRIIRDRRAKSDTLRDYPSLWTTYQQKLNEAQQGVQGVSAYLAVLDGMAEKISPAQLNLPGFKAYKANPGPEMHVRQQVLAALAQKDDFAVYRKAIADYRDHVQGQLDYELNLNFDPRGIVGDHAGNVRERRYGTPDVNATDPLHGTHVAGIGAGRNNHAGMEGVADAVQLLAIRAVPSGDERDKDVANAIRFAADHGAKVINMSFGKSYSPDKQVVDEAVAYAMKKDVLLLVAAGNEHLNLDSIANFPNKKYIAGGEAAAWIEVGASGPDKGAGLPANFSNYGKASVDLFAPGVDIWSTLPNGAYGRESGTSMACPVTCGTAALLRSYFPKLTALQVKDLLMRSVVQDPSLADKCRSGGVVNAARAVELALAMEAGKDHRH